MVVPAAGFVVGDDQCSALPLPITGATLAQLLPHYSSIAEDALSGQNIVRVSRPSVGPIVAFAGVFFQLRKPRESFAAGATTVLTLPMRSPQ